MGDQHLSMGSFSLLDVFHKDKALEKKEFCSCISGKDKASTVELQFFSLKGPVKTTNKKEINSLLTDPDKIKDLAAGMYTLRMHHSNIYNRVHFLVCREGKERERVTISVTTKRSTRKEKE